MINAIKQLPLDRSKRHFVVGDIHGRFQSFLNLLDSANYNPETDIIYAVGDLIDRGPKSYEVVEFFTSTPNVYTILGNHEYMAKTKEWTNVWLKNGGVECLQSLSKNGKDWGWLIKKIKDLPWMIEVGEDDEEGAFRLIHAEHPPHWDDDLLRRVIQEALDGEDPRLATTIWSRTTITAAQDNVNHLRPITTGIVFNENRKRRTYVGHTTTNKVINVGDLTYVDTFRSKTLSMVEALSRETFTVPTID